jgi:hypothetical protein
MIRNNDRVNGEFYIAPSYNWLLDLLSGADVTIYEIPADQHFAVGTNEDIERYMSLHASV